jgi:hypothetical protein
MKNIHLFICVLLSFTGLAQTQPEHKKKTYVDSLGRYYQQATLPVYLLISTSPDGSTEKLIPATRKEVVLEGHGPHLLKHENHVTMQNDEFTIYADGLMPVTKSSFLNAPAFLSSRQYYGPGLNVSLASKDEMSGLQGVFHAVGGKSFEKYQPISFSIEGEYSYNYYAVDNTGNAEKVNTRNFVVDLTSPESFHHIIGISSESVISITSSIYLTITDALSGVAKTAYKFDKEPYRNYPGGNISFQYLADGDHTLTYYSVDNVTNKETEKSVNFYLDKTAPIMSADVLGDKFIVGDKVYFSGRTKLKLTAVDNKSGVKEMVYAINNDPFGKYTEPFYLPGKSGYHTVRYYAVDNTSNTVKDDFHHTVGTVYVDLTGPTISHGFVGPTFVKADTIFVSPKTAISLSGTDPEAGMKKIAFTFNNATEEITYTGKPIVLSQGGFQNLNYFAYDNVNNKNSKSTFFVLDEKGPSINYEFSAPVKENKYPAYTVLYLTASDVEVGADQIQYSINGGKALPYIGPIKGFLKNKEYTIKITATDLLGNSSVNEVKFKTDRY